MLLLPFVLHAVWDYLESRRLAAAVAAIHARGEPVSIYAFEPVDLTGEAAAAARYYRAAAALGSRYADGQPGPFIDESLEYMDRGAPLEFKGGLPESSIPQLLEVYAVASLRTQRLAAAGRGHEAAASLYSKLRFTRTLANAPPFRYAAYTDFVTDITAVLSLAMKGAVDGAILEKVATALQDVDDDEGLKKFLLRERTFLLSRGPDYRRSYLFLRPLAMRQFTDRLETLASLIEAAQRPWPRRLEAPGTASGTANRQREMWRMIDEQRFGSAARTLAMLRAARVVVAAERYRLEHAVLPQTLADLVPSYLPTSPVDPYTGTPVLLTIDGDGYVAYSVGANRRDDHGQLTAGTPRPPGSRVPPDGDIGIRIAHP